MPSYRIYTLDPDGHVLHIPKEIECADDQQAIERAKQAMDGLDVEVWDRARLVVRLNPRKNGLRNVG